MPAPGEQHLNSGGKQITNPFEEVKPRLSEYTAQEIATLQSRLEKQLGPEYISSRAGPSGQKVHYLAAEKCIQLANEVFGFNGWSSQIKEVQVDFVEENPQTFRVNLGLSVIVRVTLRDGTFHEDIGYGHMENCKGKAAAFEKAKKEGTTDALKRALRNFGNVLGNCIYDKEYLKNVSKVKAAPTKWDVDRLHRHSDYTPVKREAESKLLDDKSQNGAAGANNATDDTIEDEFGEFDEADFNVADPDAHPDEVALTEPPIPSRHFNNGPSGNTTNGTVPNQNRPPVNRPQPMAAPARGTNSAQNNANQPQPQTPSGGLTRSTSWAGPGPRPNSEAAPQPRPPNPQLNPPVGRRILNQPSRNGPPSAPVSPAKQLPSSGGDSDIVSLPPQGAGFFSARAAQMIPEGKATEGPPAPIPSHFPAFNPHAESPSIRKTPGIDHKSSKPLTRDLKHVPGSTQSAALSGPIARPNVINPQLDAARRIGAPGSPSPMGNRSQYKPPTTVKRGFDNAGATAGANGRTPLTDLPANGPIGADAGGDLKRQRLNG
ncbi:uncharacterized protein LY89DRAFT_624575 [Mollisia scopiformis]|uniref:RAD52 homolog n=1 Tax=Mollisia scopiformis TaxID=149040 RepID=A0A194WVY9_MOLSC|nr:uncharacterized protein LY89DRAFT_624575 [Mollisia scopiformis]KUJ12128.1 hypothetical protein LY89DRAFT_624575 [Mollisia scopiformis]